jgi:hypothetical protein
MAGRPRTYKSVEEIEKAIDEYFNIPEIINVDSYAGTDTMQSGKTMLNPKPTITGLALHLGFESRQSLYDYEKDGEFSYTIKSARLRIEAKYEEKLYDNACTGAIFALKNFGWKDKQELEHSGNMQLTWHEEKTYEAK